MQLPRTDDVLALFAKGYDEPPGEWWMVVVAVAVVGVIALCYYLWGPSTPHYNDEPTSVPDPDQE